MKIIHGTCAEDRAVAAAPTPTEYKNCPVCGSVCFADMEVCFGCLHQFDKNDATPPTQQVDQAERSSIPHPPAMPANPGAAPSSATPPEGLQESYGEEELAALLEQMRCNFALPVQEQAPAQKKGPVEIPLHQEPPTQTAGSGQDGNGMTARHVCEGKDGQRFEITISIKLL